MEKTRYAWLDYARLMSLMLIVLLHAQPRMLVFIVGILAVFFGCSGCLCHAGEYVSFRAYFKHRLRPVAVPYIAFYAIFYVMWIVAQRRMGAADAAAPWWQPLWECLMGQPKAYSLLVLAPFWFITCLLSMQLIYYWVLRLAGQRWSLAVSVALAAVAALCPGTEHLNFWNINYAMLYMPFYALGHTMTHGRVERGVRIGWLGAVALAAAGVAIMACAAPVVQQAEWRSLLLTLGGMAVMLPLAWLATKAADRFGPRSIVAFFAANGITCLALQNYCIGALRIVMHRISPQVSVQSWPASRVIAAATMIVVGAAAWLISRYAPWLLGREKKTVNFQH